MKTFFINLFHRGLSIRWGLTLIELMVVLFIITSVMSFAVREYLQHLDNTKITRVQADLEELSKAVRLYNIREDQPFSVGTFTYEFLGNLIGTYFQNDIPLDPWSRPYLHNPDLGVLYSLGGDGIDGFKNAVSDDDVAVWYIPKEFFITRAQYVDANRNNAVDLGDFIEVTFSRPARFKDVNIFDFLTTNPEKAFGNSTAIAPSKGSTLQIQFGRPLMPTFRIGETRIHPRQFLEGITDFSTPPQTPDPIVEAVIQRKKM